MTLWQQKWVAPRAGLSHRRATVPLRHRPSSVLRVARARQGTGAHRGRRPPVKKAAYRIAAKLRLIDAARLTRPYIYY
ncbi:cittilin family RiPP precursor [Nocardiopsis changdeensis]|uniref:cittilin family RiPP precursor n=1 Tax=Nocardiopsis changdeensis TaxID=2831969 RepID=UPI003F470358